MNKTDLFTDLIAQMFVNCLGELRAENKKDEPKGWIKIDVPKYDDGKLIYAGHRIKQI